MMKRVYLSNTQFMDILNSQNIYRIIWYYQTNIENKKIFGYIVVKHALTTLVVIVIEFQNVYEPEKLMWHRDDVAFLFFLLFKNSNFLISFKKDVVGEKIKTNAQAEQSAIFMTPPPFNAIPQIMHVACTTQNQFSAMVMEPAHIWYLCYIVHEALRWGIQPNFTQSHRC